MRRSTECKAIVTGRAVNMNGINTITTEFPLTGETWERIRITLYYSITIGTGTTPVFLGGYNTVKNVSLRTGKNETICQAPGPALYWLNYELDDRPPFHTEIAASTATYVAVLDIPFHFPFLRRFEDLYLDSGRYNYLELAVQLGTIADFLGTPGTATVTTTMDVHVFRSMAGMSKDRSGEPLAVPFIKAMPSIAPASRNYFDIESALDLAIMGFLMYNTTSNSGPWVGTGADNIDLITWRDAVRQYLDRVKYTVFQQNRHRHFGWNVYLTNTPFTGIYSYRFVRDESVKSAYPTGGKSEVKLEIGSIITGTNTTDLLLYGFRAKR